MSRTGHGRSPVFWSLVRGGPQTPGELGVNNVNPRTRMTYDIRKLNPRATYGGQWASVPQRAAPVYYLAEYHDPGRVVRKWVSESERLLRDHQRFNTRTLMFALSGELREAWREARGDYDWLRNPDEGNGGNWSEKRECPRCGEEIGRTVPAHIRAGDCGA